MFQNIVTVTLGYLDRIVIENKSHASSDEYCVNCICLCNLPADSSKKLFFAVEVTKKAQVMIQQMRSLGQSTTNSAVLGWYCKHSRLLFFNNLFKQ